MKIAYQTPFVKIFYDKTVPVVYEEWVGEVSGKEFRRALEEKLKVYTNLSRSHEQLFWLNDVRKLRGVPNADQQWAVEEFHPRLFPLGVKKVAFVVPAQTYLRLTDEETLGKLDARNEVELCYFDDFESAYAWFKEGVEEPQVK